MVPRDHNAQFQKVVKHAACCRKRVFGEILLRDKCSKVESRV